MGQEAQYQATADAVAFFAVHESSHAARYVTTIQTDLKVFDTDHRGQIESSASGRLAEADDSWPKRRRGGARGHGEAEPPQSRRVLTLGLMRPHQRRHTSNQSRSPWLLDFAYRPRRHGIAVFQRRLDAIKNRVQAETEY